MQRSGAKHSREKAQQVCRPVAGEELGLGKKSEMCLEPHE